MEPSRCRIDFLSLDEPIRENGDWRYAVRYGGRRGSPEGPRYISILKYLGDAERVAVPAELEGLPVRELYFRGERTTPFKGRPSVFNDRVREITLPDGLLDIGDMAFAGCRSLERVHLPDSVRSVDAFAFALCSALTELTLPDGIEVLAFSALSGCSSLHTLHLPARLRVICGGALADCTALRELTLPAGLEELDPLLGGPALQALRVEKGNPHFTAEDGVLYDRDKTTLVLYPPERPDRAFRLPNTVRVVNEQVQARHLEELALPAGLETLSPQAFDLCRALRTVTIPADAPHFAAVDGVLYSRDMTRLMLYPAARAARSYRVPDGVTDLRGLPRRAPIAALHLPDGCRRLPLCRFAGWDRLEQVRLPADLPELPKESFRDCAALRRVELGRCTQLYARFENCPALEEIALPMSSVRYEVRDGALYTRDGRTLLRCLPGRGAEEFTVPEGVEELAPHAFDHCAALRRVTCPDSLRRVGDMAFVNCAGLEELRLPPAMEWLGFGAFMGCASLRELTIPEGVTVLRPLLFGGCAALTHLTLPATVREYEGYVLQSAPALTGVTLRGGRRRWANRKVLKDGTFPEGLTLRYTV